MPALVDKIARALRRDRHLPLRALLMKSFSNMRAMAFAKISLRRCNRVGPRPRTFGIPRVENEGTIIIGDDFAVSCRFGGALLATGPRGVLEIGNGVTVAYGTAITATERVRIGDRVMIGPHCIVSDTDVPLPLASKEDASSMIDIGQGAWLAARVVIRPGVRIGAGAVIAAGSVVETDLPANAVASGSPARVLRVRAPQPGVVPPPPSSASRLKTRDRTKREGATHASSIRP